MLAGANRRHYAPWKAAQQYAAAAIPLWNARVPRDCRYVDTCATSHVSNVCRGMAEEKARDESLSVTVAVDGCRLSQRAFEVARALVKGDGRFTVLHVSDAKAREMLPHITPGYLRQEVRLLGLGGRRARVALGRSGGRLTRR